MIGFYRTFRTLTLALSLALLPLCAKAEQDRLFTVEGVRVDVSAESATKARDEAFLKAQQDAFSRIAASNLPPERLKGFKPPAPAVIGPMIKDFEVSNEKIAPTRYIGTYTFRFYAPAVAGWLGTSAAQEGGAIDAAAAGRPPNPVFPDSAPGPDGGETITVSSSHVPAGFVPDAPQPLSTILVLPFYQWGSRTILWTDANPWRDRWAGEGSSVFILPRGDLDDVRDVADTQALTYDQTALAAMKQRYGAAQAAVLIAVPKLPSGMDVYIYDADGPEPTYLHTVSVQAGPGQDALALATQEAAAFLRTAPPAAGPLASAAAIPSATGLRTLTVRVRFSGPQEWVETQRALAAVPGVRTTEITSLSSHEATVRVMADGTEAALAAQMAAQGLTLSAPGAGGEGVRDLCYAPYCMQEAPL